MLKTKDDNVNDQCNKIVGTVRDVYFWKPISDGPIILNRQAKLIKQHTPSVLCKCPASSCVINCFVHLEKVLLVSTFVISTEIASMYSFEMFDIRKDNSRMVWIACQQNLPSTRNKALITRMCCFQFTFFTLFTTDELFSAVYMTSVGVIKRYLRETCVGIPGTHCTLDSLHQERWKMGRITTGTSLTSNVDIKETWNKAFDETLKANGRNTVIHNCLFWLWFKCVNTVPVLLLHLRL